MRLFLVGTVFVAALVACYALMTNWSEGEKPADPMLLATLKGHSGSVRSMAISADGKRIISASDDQTLKVWDADKGSETLTLKGHTGPVTSVAISVDGKRIVSGDYWDNTVKVWDADKGSDILTLRGHTGPISSVAFSPDGKRIVSGSGDYRNPDKHGEIKVWDADKGTETHSLKGHTEGVTSVAFSPDGKRIVSGSNAKPLVQFNPPLSAEIKLWDTEKGTETLSFKGHDADILSVAFSPDGKRIVSGSYDYTLKVWDAKTP